MRGHEPQFPWARPTGRWLGAEELPRTKNYALAQSRLFSSTFEIRPENPRQSGSGSDLWGQTPDWQAILMR